MSKWRIEHINLRATICNLKSFDKQSTAPSIFKALFNELKSNYNNDNWNFLYTDGSKTTNHVGFAVVDENGLVLKHGLLPQNANIFEAEAEAVIEALKLSKNSLNKTIICTDSRSVFDATYNYKNKNLTISNIQQLLIQMKNKVKLLWIPSHVGIRGNEAADKAAKSVHLHPTQLIIPQSKSFIARNQITCMNLSISEKWNRYNHFYRIINPTRKPLQLPTSTNWHKNKCFIRLRLTHTMLTHQYLITKSPKPMCTFCNKATLTTIHLLSDCPSLINTRLRICNTNNITDLLAFPTENNINRIYEFLKYLNLQNLI